MDLITELAKAKADAAEQRARAEKAEAIADEALDRAMTASINWKREKELRKMAEVFIRGVQSLFYEAEKNGLIERYQPHYEEDPEIPM
jgi:hypothetical protein